MMSLKSMKSMKSMRFYYNNSESLYIWEIHQSTESLWLWVNLNYLSTGSPGYEKRGGGNINSIWENNEWGWEKGDESSLTPERVFYPRGGVGISNLSFLRISMVDFISRRVWEGVLPILEAKWGLWGVPRKCGQIWCLCWAMVILGVKPGSWV